MIKLRKQFYKNQKGFSAVELLVTLFIAAAFLFIGYELFTIITDDKGEAQSKARASTVAHEYLQQHKSSATNPCTPQSPLTGSEVNNIDGLLNVQISISITCPYTETPEISKIISTIKYNNPQKELSISTLHKP